MNDTGWINANALEGKEIGVVELVDHCSIRNESQHIILAQFLVHQRLHRHLQVINITFLKKIGFIYLFSVKISFVEVSYSSAAKAIPDQHVVEGDDPLGEAVEGS